jgi:hypothetical protein
MMSGTLVANNENKIGLSGVYPVYLASFGHPWLLVESGFGGPTAYAMMGVFKAEITSDVDRLTKNVQKA